MLRVPFPFAIVCSDYPYPLNAKGNPIDTPEWRNADDIGAHAPTKFEKKQVDSALFKAIREYDDSGMGPVDAAIAAGADINAQDKFGFTALHLAIKSKNTALANKLLEMEGISLDIKTNKGFTPMLVAAWKGDLNLVQKLITKGCDIKAKDTAGRNVWGVAHDWHHEEVRVHPPLPLAPAPCVGCPAPACSAPHPRAAVVAPPPSQILELLKRNDFHYYEGDVLAFPPAPKWRPEHRGKL